MIITKENSKQITAELFPAPRYTLNETPQFFTGYKALSVKRLVRGSK